MNQNNTTPHVACELYDDTDTLPVVSSQRTLSLQELLAENLLRLRTRKRLTQEQAAERVGINWRHWQKLESGEVNVTLTTIEKLCTGLNVEIRTLFRPVKR